METVMQTYVGTARRWRSLMLAILLLPVGVYAQAPSWSVDPAGFESNINVTGALYLEGVRATNAADRVAAFVGEEVRGVAAPITLGGASVFFMTVYANTNGETITFRAFDGGRDVVVDVAETLQFEANGVHGTLSSPFVWNAGGKLGTVTPQSPPYASENQPTTLQLEWLPVSGASGYDLDLATTADFIRPKLSLTGITGTSTTVEELEEGTRYYWRVRAVKSGEAGDWSPAFFFRTFSEAEVPKLVEPEDLAEGQPLEPTLRWRAVESTLEYEVELSEQADFSTLTKARFVVDTLAVIEDLAPVTTYYWRVRATTTSVIGRWTTARRFTTAEEAIIPPLATPDPVAPADGASGLSLTPSLSWSSIAGASSYDVDVSLSPAFETTVRSEREHVNATLALSGLTPGTTYHWRVRAANANEQTAWSAVARFTTEMPAPGVPSSPRMLAPSADAAGLGPDLTLEWLSAARASSYQLQIAGSDSFEHPLVDRSGLADPSFHPDGLETGTTYFWRVRAHNEGGAGVWASARRFTTRRAAPPPPVPKTPEGGASSAPTLVWEGLGEGAVYDVELSLNDGFAPVLRSISGLSAVRYTAGGLPGGTTYYWRVRSRNEGGASSWSPSNAFTTVVAVPIPMAPEDEASSLSVTPSFQWSPVDGAEEYHLVYSRGPEHDEQFVAVTSTTYRPNQALDAAALYLWKVRASGGAYSTVQTFQTGVSGEMQQAAVKPAPVSPSRGSTIATFSPTLQWTPVPDATGYDVQVASNAAFTSIALSGMNVREPLLEASSLSPGRTYYWRVRARDGRWSAGSYFRTPPPPPDVPVTIAPADEEAGVSTAPVLQWASSAGASTYHVQVAPDPAFSELVHESEGLTQSSARVGGLRRSTSYYWRVRASGDGGTGSWSIPSTFRTYSVRYGEAVVLPGQSFVDLADVDVHLAFSSVDAAARVNVAHVSGTPSPPVPGFVPAGSGFWSIDQDGAGSLEAEICFPLDLFRAGVDPAELRIYKRTDAGSPWQALETTLRAGSLCASVTSFSDFAVIRRIPPSSPALVAPAPDAVGVPPTTTLEWSRVAGASSYRMQLSEQSTFGTLILDEDGIPSTSLDAAGLNPGTTYFWRVRGENEIGSGDWSGAGVFETVAVPPSAPGQLAPEDAAAGVGETVVLSWESASDDVLYDLQLATDAAFTQVVAFPGGLSTLDYTATNLIEGATYHWRVRTVSIGGAGAWSPARTFRTAASGVTSPAAATLLSPADGSADQPVVPRLTWSPAEGASRYEVQVSQFGEIILSVDDVVETSYTAPDLEFDNTYFWRVRGVNSAGSSAWSPVYRFTTAVPAPDGVPQGLVPLDGEAVSAVPAVLSWQPVQRSSRYHLQVAARPDFSGELAANVDSSSGTSYAIPPGILLPETSYYWRVRAVNGNGSGPWSPVLRFVAPDAAPGPPVPFEPADDALVAGTNPTLLWHGAERASAYDVQVAADSMFSALIDGAENYSSTWFRANGIESGPTYYWRVRGVGRGGRGDWSPVFRFRTGTSTDVQGVDADVPAVLELGANYPNPFNPTTSIPYGLPEAAHVRLTVYDALGREVRRLVDNWQGAGRYSASFDAAGLPSGVYVYRLQTGERTHTRSLLLLK